MATIEIGNCAYDRRMILIIILKQTNYHILKTNNDFWRADSLGSHLSVILLLQSICITYHLYANIFDHIWFDLHLFNLYLFNWGDWNKYKSINFSHINKLSMVVSLGHKIGLHFVRTKTSIGCNFPFMRVERKLFLMSILVFETYSKYSSHVYLCVYLMCVRVFLSGAYLKILF